jgi:hypothetical protein
VKEFRFELFPDRCKYDTKYMEWDNWFCFGCAYDQPKMTTYFTYDDDGPVTEGEIYLCEDYAKKLYLNEE